MPALSARCREAKAKRAGKAFSRLIASTKDSVVTERMASPARVAIISSGSPARTARISARSAGSRCAPPVQTASLRSRVARPCRRSSTTSGLRVSTGYLPQVLVGIYHSTERSRRTEGRHRSAVQLQQHDRGVRRANVELAFRGEMQGFAGVHSSVEKDVIIGNDPNMRRPRGGKREFQGYIGRRSHLDRSFLRSGMSIAAAPSVPTRKEN